MSVTTRALPAEPITWDEWLALGETEERYEVVDGRLQMSHSPTRRHQYAAGKLTMLLMVAAEPHGIVIVPDVDWKLWEAPRLQVRRPDIIAIPADDLETQQPDLAVEILSPGNRGTDLVDKVEEYARAGLDVYWIVEIEGTPEVIVYHRRGSQLVEVRRYRGDDELTEEVPFPVRFRPSVLTPQ
jgi:Uma2 family endonuclease